MAAGKGAKLLNPCKRGDSGGSGVAQKLLEPIGVLEGLWPPGRGQNCLNLVKAETLEALEWLRSY